VQHIVRGMEEFRQTWLQTLAENGHKVIPKRALWYKPKEGEMQDDRGNNGVTNFTLRVKE